jgi:uncharacterized protein YjbI with pentapeptide repeats
MSASSLQPSATATSDEGPLWKTVLGWLVLAAAVATGVFYLFARLQSGSWTPWRKGPRSLLEIYELSRSTVAVTGLLGAAVAAGLATRRQRSNEASVQIARKTQLLATETHALEVQRADSDVVRQLRERYASAAGQLGDDSSAVRLAGVYAMAALADDWLRREVPSDNAQACVDVLCAYLRAPRSPGTGSSGSADREVRQTIARVIAQHLQAEAPSTWSDMRLDFTNSVLHGEFIFDGSQFRGPVSFAGVEFDGGRASFAKVTFDRTGGAPASFRGAQVYGDVSFTNAVFAQGLDLSETRVKGGAITTRGAEFRGALLLDRLGISEGSILFETATFSSGAAVSLDGSIDTGRVSFTGAVFDNATISVGPLSLDDGGGLVFRGCRLESCRIAGLKVEQGNGTIDFGEAVARGGTEIILEQSSLSGLRLSFKGAQLLGARIRLNEVSAADQVHGPWSPGTFTGEWNSAQGQGAS